MSKVRKDEAYASEKLVKQDKRLKEAYATIVDQEKEIVVLKRKLGIQHTARKEAQAESRKKALAEKEDKGRIANKAKKSTKKTKKS